MAENKKKENSKKTSSGNGEGDVPAGQPGVLPGQEIKNLELIKQIGPDCLKAMSCDLRLGPKVFVCGQEKVRFLTLEESAVFDIKPFEMVLFQTEEIIDLEKRRDIVGRFDLMIGYGLDGFILQVGPQVEPGYSGPLFGFLVNTLGCKKSIRRGQRFLTIEFHRVSDAPIKELFKPDKIEDLNQFLEKQGIDRDRLTAPSAFQQITETLDNCKREHGLKIEGEDRVRSKSDLKWTKIAAIAAVVMIFLAILTILVTLFPNKTRSILRIDQNQKNTGVVVSEPNENSAEDKTESNDNDISKDKP